jgi:epoxyqueuosine reductase
VKEIIRAKALELGFISAGFAKAELSDEVRANLATYLERGHHGGMEWMATHAERRGDPRSLWPEVKTAIMLGTNYAPPPDSFGPISVYARGKDYHDIVKPRLKALAAWLVGQYGGEVKVFIDTAPLMEKPLAALAGLGWPGKHTNIVSRQHGCWLFLGAVLTTLEIAPDEPEKDHCGGCTRCISACPTQAFRGPRRIDARRCISYLTIEHKGHIPRELRPLMGNRIYGCDDCLAACPWNRFATPHEEPDFRAAAPLPSLEELVRLDDAGFRKLFAGSPIKRTKRDRFVRNVLIALGNQGCIGEFPYQLLEDESPLVRTAAAWAASRLLSAEEYQSQRARRLAQEEDEEVKGEWGKT